MISINGKGDFSKTRSFLNSLKRRRHLTDLDRYGEMGVEALAQATPRDTGLTALSWKYRIVQDKRRTRIDWYNTNEASTGVSVAVIIQYGHGTRSGSYVQGIDYINPALRPVFERIANDVWKKVNSL